MGPDFIAVSGIDLIDGTPILDVKPYIPYDVVQECTPSEQIPLPMSVQASTYTVTSFINDNSSINGSNVTNGTEIDKTSAVVEVSPTLVGPAGVRTGVANEANVLLPLDGKHPHPHPHLFRTGLRVPAWIIDADVPMNPVAFEESALASLATIAAEVYTGSTYYTVLDVLYILYYTCCTYFTVCYRVMSCIKGIHYSYVRYYTVDMQVEPCYR